MHYDTNVTGAPSSNTINLPSFPGQPVVLEDEVGDGQFSATASVTHTYKFRDSCWAWKTNVLNYNALYDTLYEEDLNYVTVATGPSIKAGGRAADLQVFAEYVEKGYRSYMRTAGLRLSAFDVVNEGLCLAAGAKCVWKRYTQDPQRDAVKVSLGVGPIIAWGKSRLTLRGEVEVENASDGENFDPDEESYLKWAGSAGFDRRLSERIGVFVRCRVQKVDYEAPYVLFAKHRNDVVQDYTVGLSLQVTPATEVELSHTYTERGSTVELYRYRRHVSSLIFNYRF